MRVQLLILRVSYLMMICKLKVDVLRDVLYIVCVHDVYCLDTKWQFCIILKACKTGVPNKAWSSIPKNLDYV